MPAILPVLKGVYIAAQNIRKLLKMKCQSILSLPGRELRYPFRSREFAVGCKKRGA
jgi:hypothetical protein